MDVDKYQDILDSRDVIERLEELAGAWTDHANGEGDALDSEELEELKELTALAEEGEGLADWPYGETLVRDSYFTEYAQELADDIGALSVPDASRPYSEKTVDLTTQWPFTCIDWEWAARELRMDYTPLDFGGVTYWGRS